MAHLSIRDLQKISSEKISSLAGPTPIKSGEHTIAVLIPLKVADMKKLAAALKRAEELAKERDPEEDRKILAELGEVPIDWSAEIPKLKAEAREWASSRSAKRLGVGERAQRFVSRKRSKPRKPDR